VRAASAAMPPKRGDGAPRVDRRALREALGRARQAPSNKRLLGFDFDCTLTVRHFYKVMAWGYARRDLKAHPHCQALAEWCEQRGVAAGMDMSNVRVPMGEDIMMLAVTEFCEQAGDEAFNALFREVFLGGEERIQLVAGVLQRLRERGCEFAIITRGISTSVLRGLVAVPEWLPFFPSSHVWDCSQNRHQINSSIDQKSLMLRDICPSATQILLVDDAVDHDGSDAWVLKAAGVETFALPYEGPGVTESTIKEIEEIMTR